RHPRHLGRGADRRAGRGHRRRREVPAPCPTRSVDRGRWRGAPVRPRSRRTRLTAVADRTDRRPRAHPALRPPREGHHTRPVATHDGRVEGPGPTGTPDPRQAVPTGRSVSPIAAYAAPPARRGAPDRSRPPREGGCEVSEDRSYTWAGAGGPFTVTVAPGVFMPSSTSRVLGDAVQVRAGDTVLDAGCGCGVLGLAAARRGAGRVVGCDVSPAAVACATGNARRLGLAEVAEFRQGPLLEPVADVRADVVIADVSGVPDAVAAVTGWFPDG